MSDKLIERNIEYLVHFTDSKNLDSIMKHGIFSVTELEKMRMSFNRNDENRYDGRRDYISVSVTEPNKYFLEKCLREHIMQSVVLIYIDSKILLDKILEDEGLIFCETNAATKSAHKGSSVEDFERMFAENVSYTLSNGADRNISRDKDKSPSLTTDPQAEILIKKHIPCEYIRYVKNISGEIIHENSTPIKNVENKSLNESFEADEPEKGDDDLAPIEANDETIDTDFEITIDDEVKDEIDDEQQNKIHDKTLDEQISELKTEVNDIQTQLNIIEAKNSSNSNNINQINSQIECIIDKIENIIISNNLDEELLIAIRKSRKSGG